MPRLRLSALAALLLIGCGSTEEAEPAEPAEPTAAAEEAPADEAPEPPPEPEPVGSCPDDTWSVGADGPNRATDSGVEASGWARQMGGGWESLRVCRTFDGFEHLLSCAPVDGGAECSVALPDRSCSATLPRPVLPVAVGQWVDTHELPSQGEWSCSPR